MKSIRRDITLLTANFNDPILTLYMLRSFVKAIGDTICPICLLDNSTKNYLADIVPQNKIVTVVDNTNFKLTPNYRQSSLNHCASLEYAMNNCIATRYVLLCDNDILFFPAIRDLLSSDFSGYDAIGEIGYDYTPPNRLLPYMCIIDLDKKRTDNISYFDPRRIMWQSEHNNKIHDGTGRGYLDTGASFLQDIINSQWHIYPIAISQYITHLKGASNKHKNYYGWLGKFHSLYE